MLNDAWSYKVKKKKGLYGETDLDKKVMIVNKSEHKFKSGHRSDVKKNPDGTASILDTIVHEHLHKVHPKAHEKTVRKLTRKRLKKISKKTKSKLYNKFN